MSTSRQQDADGAPADPPPQAGPRSRHYLFLGALVLALCAFWLGARLGSLTAFGTGGGLNQGTWLPTPAAPEAYIRGAVTHPALYPLAPNVRLAGLLRQAGGPARCADLSRINLAAPVVDGETITIPRRRDKDCRAP